MKKFVMLLAGVAVLCGVTALAQPKPGGRGPQGGSPVLDPTEEQIARAHHMYGLLVRAIREGEHDAATWPLVTKALADRTTMLQAELNRVSKLEALLTAFQGGDKNAIQAARQDVKTATETVAAAAKTFMEDAGGIRDHLKSEHGAQPGATTTTAPPATK